MNTRPFGASLSAVAVLLGFATLVHTQAVETESKDHPVKIGAIYNLSGSQASLGRPSLDGSILAAEEVNARGGAARYCFSYNDVESIGRPLASMPLVVTVRVFPSADTTIV
jgi:hypothetical protein